MTGGKPRIHDRAHRILQRLTGSAEPLEEIVDSDRSERIAERLHQIEQLFLLHGGQRTGPDLAELLFEWGHLQVLELIGEGSFGQVYRAYDSVLDREVALKLLKTDQERPFQSQVFLHEGRQLAMVRHRNVLAVHGAAVNDGRAGLWTDLVDGETAQSDRYRNELAQHSAALEFIESVARALQAVHSAGLVHGDIKPGNVMRDVAGDWILMDFGASLDSRNSRQAPPIASGTPLYMAPEVVLGGVPDVHSDIYSLGATFYRVLTGSPPIESQDWNELKALHQGDRAIPPARLESDPQGRIGRLVDRMLSVDPQQRPDSGQILAEIQSIREAPHRRFRRIAFGSIAAVLVVGLIASSIGFFRAESALEQARLEQANTDAVNQFLQRILLTPSATGRARDVNVEDMLRFAAEDSQSSLAAQPNAQVVVNRVLADSFNVLNRPELALEQIGLARETLVQNNLSLPQEARALDLMEIRAAEIQERHEDAIALADAFIDRYLGVLGDSDRQIRWARLYKVTNLLALSRFDSALEIMVEHFTDIPSPEVAERDFGYGILQAWVNVYKRLGRYQEAAERAEEALDWLQRYPRARLFHKAYALANLALALSDINEQDRAIGVFKDALPLFEQIFGRGSRDHVGIWVNLASAQREAGRVIDAQQSLEQALELMRRFPQESTTELQLVVQMNLSNLLNANGEASRSEALMRDARERMIEHWGRSHSNTLIQELNLSELLSQQQRFEEARALAEETLETMGEAFGESHVLTLLGLDNLAVALNGLDRGEEALELHDRALAALAEQLGSDHPYALRVERSRMTTLQSVSPGEANAGAIEALIRRHEEALGPDHFDTEKARGLLEALER